MDISSVINAGEHYWYCRGDFHSQGKPSDPIISATPSSSAALCLVGSNARKDGGTVHWYGIDGVCHQVSNQLLYATGLPNGSKPGIVSAARGYRFSSALFGTYGRREREWIQARIGCGVAPMSIFSRRSVVSLLSRRVSFALGLPLRDRRVMELELARRQLLTDLDDIGFAARSLDETANDRVDRLNQRINSFLQFAITSFNDERIFMRIFGIREGEQMYLIDPELFEFPEPSDRPERNMIVGW